MILFSCRRLYHEFLLVFTFTLHGFHISDEGSVEVSTGRHSLLCGDNTSITQRCWPRRVSPWNLPKSPFSYWLITVNLSRKFVVVRAAPNTLEQLDFVRELHDNMHNYDVSTNRRRLFFDDVSWLHADEFSIDLVDHERATATGSRRWRGCSCSFSTFRLCLDLYPAWDMK